jgi:hypothetical protein
LGERAPPYYLPPVPTPPPNPEDPFGRPPAPGVPPLPEDDVHAACTSLHAEHDSIPPCMLPIVADPQVAPLKSGPSHCSEPSATPLLLHDVAPGPPSPAGPGIEASLEPQPPIAETTRANAHTSLIEVLNVIVDLQLPFRLGCSSSR